ncbi:MAG: glycosyltransferase family 39 protein [Pseudomonadota bacterium]
MKFWTMGKIAPPDQTASARAATLRSPVFLLTVIVLAGTYLRASTLGFQPFWQDEVLTLGLAQAPFSRWLQGYVDVSPPFYYLLHQALFGEAIDPVVVRSLSLILGILTIPLCYLIGREVHSPSLGLVAAALIAVSDIFIEYSQEARGYALWTFAIAAATLFMIRVLRTSDTRSFVKPLIFANIACLAAAYTHYSVLFWIACMQLAMFVAVLSAPDDRKARLTRFMAVSAATAFAAIPLAFFLSKAIADGGPIWISTPDIGALRGTYHQLLMLRGFSIGPAWAALPIYLIAAFGLVCTLRLDKAARFIVLSLALYPLLLFAVSMIKPVLLTRSALPGAIGLALLIAIALHQVPKAWRWAPTLAIIATFTLSSVMFARNPVTHDDFTFDAATILKEKAGPDDLVLFVPRFNWKPLAYHLGQDFAPPLASSDAPRATLYPDQIDGKPPWLSHIRTRTVPDTQREGLLAPYDRIWGFESFHRTDLTTDEELAELFKSTILFDQGGERIILFERRKPGSQPTQ